MIFAILYTIQLYTEILVDFVRKEGGGNISSSKIEKKQLFFGDIRGTIK